MKFVSREGELIAVQIFPHVLYVGRTSERQHADLHGKSKYDLGHSGFISLGHRSDARIDKHFPICCQQGKALIDDTVCAAEVPYRLIPPEGRVTTVLHHHWF